jgi:hypothetical protein
MRGINKHYRAVSRELALSEGPREERALPSAGARHRAGESKLHKPTMRAIAYARATRPSYLEAITVDVDPEDDHGLRKEWDAARTSRCT